MQYKSSSTAKGVKGQEVKPIAVHVIINCKGVIRDHGVLFCQHCADRRKLLAVLHQVVRLLLKPSLNCTVMQQNSVT